MASGRKRYERRIVEKKENDWEDRKGRKRKRYKRGIEEKKEKEWKEIGKEGKERYMKEE